MALHALLGPSSAKRWIECPASARVAEHYPEEESEYAAEGTDAHLYAELLLLNDLPGLDQFKDESKYYNMEMHFYIMNFLEEVERRHNEHKVRSRDAVLMPEQYLKYEKWVPEGFGTGDITLISDGILEIIDLKYGKGVPVQAYNNPQIKTYGLAAYDMFSWMYDIHTVRLTIIQPRLDSVTSEDISVKDLLKWADDILMPAGILAWNGIGSRKAGHWCQFCKAKADCPNYKALTPAQKRRKTARAMTREDAINDFN